MNNTCAIRVRQEWHTDFCKVFQSSYFRRLPPHSFGVPLATGSHDSRGFRERPSGRGNE